MMIFEAKIHPRRFSYIEFYCDRCKAEGVSLDIKKIKCPRCEKTLSHIWEQEKKWIKDS
jgi:Zn finger protein HypA/HybF involved in hydrogenase expression